MIRDSNLMKKLSDTYDTFVMTGVKLGLENDRRILSLQQSILVTGHFAELIYTNNTAKIFNQRPVLLSLFLKLYPVQDFLKILFVFD